MFVSQRLAVKVNYASSVVPGAARAFSVPNQRAKISVPNQRAKIRVPNQGVKSGCQIRVSNQGGHPRPGAARACVGFIVDGLAKLYER